MLGDLLRQAQRYTAQDGERFYDAVQNARFVTDDERYYRTMYYGSRASWKLRDSHMFATLEALLAFHGAQSKAIVWAHNAHVGDATATEMSRLGEHNIGQLCRMKFGSALYLAGFGTHCGAVAAASDWNGPMEIKPVRASMAGGYERLCHTTNAARFMLPLRHQRASAWMDALADARLQRAIGVVYRPETEPGAVTPLGTETVEGLPDTYPFRL